MQQKNGEIIQKTQQGTKWSVTAEVVAKAILPISNMILARLLTPEAFGVVATVNMVVSFAEVFSDAGFQKYLIQHDFADKEDFFKSTTVAFWSNFLISISAWLIIFLFSGQIASFLGNESLGMCVWIAALAIPLNAFSSMQLAHYRKAFKFKILFYFRLIGAAIPLLITVPLAFATRSYWALIIGTLSGNLVNAIALTICSEWRPSLFFSFRRLTEMFHYSWWILLESIVVWFTSYIGTFIVAAYLTPAEVGFYKTGISTVNQIFSLITASTSAPLFSALSALKDDDIAFENTYIRYIRSIAVFVIPLGMGIYIYRDLVTAILLGEQWTSISDFVGMYGLISSISLVWGTYCNGVYNAKGKPHLSVIAQILYLIVLIPAILVGCKVNFNTLCVMRSLSKLQLVFAQAFIMSKIMQIPSYKYIVVTWPTILCTILMVAVGIISVSITSNMVVLSGTVILCILVYFASYHLLFRKVLMDSFLAIGISVPSLKKDNNCKKCVQ